MNDNNNVYYKPCRILVEVHVYEYKHIHTLPSLYLINVSIDQKYVSLVTSDF